MKENEKIFFKVCYNLRSEKEVYYIIRELTDKIPVKQMIYYVKKWDEFGFYDWGTNLLFGWFYPEKLPERYKKLIENEDE